MDHYQYLGVGRSASPNQIEAAARLALLRHGADAELTDRIMDAWYVVGDPDRRFEYDFWLLTHPSSTGALASVGDGAAPARIPEPDLPRLPGKRRPPGTLPPAGSIPSTLLGIPDGTAAAVPAETPSWRAEAPGRVEGFRAGLGRHRRAFFLCLVAVTLGLVVVLVTSAPSPGMLLVNGLCWVGLVLVGRLWPREKVQLSRDR
ncbi:hypothetical protein ACSYDW_15350 [Paeniglutamicibacter sp. R2-26]|uniref:J domain-containing protein n=1 Tax=Paeniglutamicibacter sp. R2-26 TaxID=3144417 RepID=UPI003EE74C0B